MSLKIEIYNIYNKPKSLEQSIKLDKQNDQAYNNLVDFSPYY